MRVTASYLMTPWGCSLMWWVLYSTVRGKLGAPGQEEPGEYRWILERDGTEKRLRVLGFRDAESPEPDEKGALVFETRLPR